MSAQRYATLVENHEWEGEIWRFHFPVDGPDEILRLHQLLDNRWCASFEVLEGMLSEDAVDILVRFSKDGYMASDHKVGALDLDKIAEMSEVERGEALYKGGVRKLVKK